MAISMSFSHGFGLLKAYHGSWAGPAWTLHGRSPVVGVQSKTMGSLPWGWAEKAGSIHNILDIITSLSPGVVYNLGTMRHSIYHIIQQVQLYTMTLHSAMAINMVFHLPCIMFCLAFKNNRIYKLHAICSVVILWSTTFCSDVMKACWRHGENLSLKQSNSVLLEPLRT